MELIVLKQAQRELKDAPKDVVGDIFALFDDLMGGKLLSMPISRPLPLIARDFMNLDFLVRAASIECFMLLKWALRFMCFMRQEKNPKKQIVAQSI